MTKSIKILSIAALVFLLSGPIYASNNKDFNFYLAAGPNFIFPTSVRVGWNQWEFGLLNRRFLGFNKIFPISGRSTYVGFGLGINADPFQTNLGFQSSIGFNYDWFWNFGLRGEMLAYANLNGYTTSYALLGVSYGF